MRRLLREMFVQPASALASAARMLTHQVGRGIEFDAVVSRMARGLSRTPAGADEHTPFFNETGGAAQREREATAAGDEHFQGGGSGETRRPEATAREGTQMAAANTNAEAVSG